MLHTWPNGQVFFSKYQRVGSDGLPECVRIRRTYVKETNVTRRQQVGRGLDLSMAIDLGRRAAGSRLVKMMIYDPIDYIPTAYEKLKTKLKTKM